ncbi:fimbrial protein [Citrobacter sp. RHBSTW-00671]|uniref:fimbrial protein n=1 Tax=Citrobacter sp. RHBSTW-00671 TaxID=2742660 RepID=UPI0017D27B25|nr:fimbrial protein [Citrobacter sp. RHBSTW-00671]MBA7966423.1 type 1 fimbrial protein [Citrobacter sp. RHBSTW-00671]HCJ6374031.1 type 1 fimbrial protein [Citrobacter freundii]
MNKIAKSIAASLLALSAGSAWATNGTIEFTGAILTSTCEFANGDTINVELGHYAANQFKSIGDRSPAIPVDIPLKNCPTAPWKHLDGTTDNSFQMWLETRSGGTVAGYDDLAAVGGLDVPATGVGIRIDRASDGKQISLNKLTEPKISFTPEADGTTTVGLQAYYVSTAAITPGEANATVDVTIDYR